MAVDLTNPYAQELAGVERNRALAQALMQSGQQQPQGQMISGRYVAPSFAQNLVPVVNTLAGGYIQNQADEKALKTAQQLRDLYASEIKGFREDYKKDPEGALIKYSMAYNPALSQSITKQLTQGPKWERTSQFNKEKGVYEVIAYDANSPNPEATKRVIAIEKPETTWADQQRVAQGWANVNLAKARAIDEGIPIGGAGGGGAPAMPMVGGGQPIVTPVVNQPTAKPVSLAPNAPAYAQGSVTMQPTNVGNIPIVPQINLAGVSPKEQRAIAGKAQETLQANVKNAYEAYPVIKEIQQILPNATSGYLEQGWKLANRAFGSSTKASPIDSQLDILGTKLVMLQPRFEGQQSNLDVKLYEKAAGDIANSNLPIADRLAALEQIKNIYKRYSPNLDWSFSEAQPSVSSSPQAKPTLRWNPQTNSFE